MSIYVNRKTCSGKSRSLGDFKSSCEVSIIDDTLCIVESKKATRSLSRFVATYKKELTEVILKYGALLLRGFRVDSAQALGFISHCIGSGPLDLNEETSPRTNVGNGIFTSTEYTSNEPIEFHNECSYQHELPRYLYMYCQTPAIKGGATRLANCEKIAKFMNKNVKEIFKRDGYLYERNYLPNTGVSWKESFGVDTIDSLKKYCSDRNIEVEEIMVSNMNEVLVSTRQQRNCFAKHPVSGRDLWLNHCLFFNHFSLPTEYRNMLESRSDCLLPFNTKYGSSEAIPKDVIQHIKSLYEDFSIEVEWKTNDVLVFDNLMCAHARQPFSGDRKVYLSMSDLISWEELV